MPLTLRTRPGGHRALRLCEQFGRSRGAQPLAHGGPERGGVGGGAVELVTDPARAIGQPDEHGQPQSGASRHAVGADRGVTGGVQCANDGALGREAGESVAVCELRGSPCDRVIGGARLQHQAALARRGHDPSGVERRPLAAAAEPVESRLCQHDRVEVTVGEAPKTCVDVAPQVTHFEVRSLSEQRGAAAQAAGADHRPLGELVERSGAAERVALVGALRDAHDREPVRQLRRHVLRGVNGEVDRARQQGVLDLLDEA
jgi:hypothetical protein